MMKNLGFFLKMAMMGSLAGLAGAVVHYFIGKGLLSWLIAGAAIALVVCPGRLAGGGNLARRVAWGLGGLLIIAAGDYLGRLINYTLVAWALLGTILVAGSAGGGWGRKSLGGVLGFLAGLVGMHALPLMTIVVLPTLGVATTFSYDIEEIGFLLTGMLIASASVLLRKENTLPD